MSDTPISSRMPAHPCYGFSHSTTAARVHLPVAPRCNVQCRFCDRSFDCANESRPGVTARLLSPDEGAARVDALRKRLPSLTVVGIAGPGDPLANPRESLETFKLVRERHPDLILCLATNGLALVDHVGEIERIGVSHLTVTVNAIDPTIGERIYSWVRIEGRSRTGVPAAALLWERQLAGIALAARRGIEVKINTIMIPGVNEGEVERIARECAVLGAKCMNIVPLIPVKGTALESAGAPDPATVARLRANASEHLPQLSHCARCRADAAGPLGSDIPAEELARIEEEAVPERAAPRPCGEPNLRSSGGALLAAVASREGFFVNQHLGEADRLFIFRVGGDGTVVAQSARPLPPPGGGDERWAELVKTISDCGALFASGLGAAPRRALEAAGIRVHVVEGLAAEALRAAAAGRSMDALAPRAACASGCPGAARGGCGCA